MNRKGFTLIELLVSISLFSLLITAVVGVLTIFINTNIRNQNERQSLQSISFAIEAMSREIRLGYSYFCSTETNPTNFNVSADCLNAKFLSFIRGDGSNDKYVSYTIDGGNIKRCQSNSRVCTEKTNLNSNLFSVDNDGSYFDVKVGSNSQQPRVKFVISSSYRTDYVDNVDRNVVISTQVTQRRLGPSNVETGGFVASTVLNSRQLRSYVFTTNVNDRQCLTQNTDGDNVVDDSCSCIGQDGISYSISVCRDASINPIDIAYIGNSLVTLGSNRRLYSYSGLRADDGVNIVGYSSNTNNDLKLVQKMFSRYGRDLFVTTSDGKVFKVSGTAPNFTATLLDDSSAEDNSISVSSIDTIIENNSGVVLLYDSGSVYRLNRSNKWVSETITGVGQTQLVDISVVSNNLELFLTASGDIYFIDRSRPDTDDIGINEYIPGCVRTGSNQLIVNGLSERERIVKIGDLSTNGLSLLTNTGKIVNVDDVDASTCSTIRSVKENINKIFSGDDNRFEIALSSLQSENTKILRIFQAPLRVDETTIGVTSGSSIGIRSIETVAAESNRDIHIHMKDQSFKDRITEINGLFGANSLINENNVYKADLNTGLIRLSR